MAIDIHEAGRAFVDKLKTRNLVLQKNNLIADGNWQYCRAANKDGNRGKNDGRYKLWLDGRHGYGIYENHTDGRGVDNWEFKSDKPMTREETARMKEAMAAARRESREELENTRKQARITARMWWKLSKSNDPKNHPYLKRKKIGPHGVRQYDDMLIIPMYLDEKDEIQSLQRIWPDPDTKKKFLFGGLVKGCFYRIAAGPDDPGNTLVIAEGFATGASIREATGHAVYVAFDAGNLMHVARTVRKRHPDAKIVIAADDDWKNKDGNVGIDKAAAAAVAINGLLAIPEFGSERRDGETDFNDLATAFDLKAVAEDIAKAKTIKFKKNDTGHSDMNSNDDNEQRLDELAGMSDIEYERIRKDEARQFEWRTSVLDKEREKRRAVKAAANDAEPPPPPDIGGLKKSARHIIASKNVLDLFERDFEQLMAGEKRNAKLLLLVGTSRMFDDTMHAAIKGPSSAGKTSLRKNVLKFVPPESVLSFTTLSGKALLYMADGFEHKILSMGEAMDGEEMKFQDQLLRQLMTDHKLEYPVVQKVNDKLETVVVVKNGPVVFMTTTTKNKLHPENETRLLSFETDDSASQTERVLDNIADRMGLNIKPDIDFAPWHDFQRWLAAGPLDVVVPFARALASCMDVIAVRQRRDFPQTIMAIKCHALLHREHRERDETGAIKATIDEDYATVRELMLSILEISAELKLSKKVQRTIEAVEEITAKIHAENRGATVHAVADKLGIERSTAARRLNAAREAAYIENVEKERGKMHQYKLVSKYQDGIGVVLPHLKTLRRKWRELCEKDVADVAMPKKASK